MQRGVLMSSLIGVLLNNAEGREGICSTILLVFMHLLKHDTREVLLPTEPEQFRVVVSQVGFWQCPRFVK